jgi:hypothetical protein
MERAAEAFVRRWWNVTNYVVDATVHNISSEQADLTEPEAG